MNGNLFLWWQKVGHRLYYDFNNFKKFLVEVLGVIQKYVIKLFTINVIEYDWLIDGIRTMMQFMRRIYSTLTISLRTSFMIGIGGKDLFPWFQVPPIQWSCSNGSWLNILIINSSRKTFLQLLSKILGRHIPKRY